jgi:hypothetical protein
MLVGDSNRILAAECWRRDSSGFVEFIAEAFLMPSLFKILLSIAFVRTVEIFIQTIIEKMVE